jgi:hypothetical protein
MDEFSAFRMLQLAEEKIDLLRVENRSWPISSPGLCFILQRWIPSTLRLTLAFFQCHVLSYCALASSLESPIWHAGWPTYWHCIPPAVLITANAL